MPKRKKNLKKDILSTYPPKKMADEFRAYCERKHRSVSEMLQYLIDKLLKKKLKIKNNHD